ncbi:MAG: AAA-associated domain-containing protein [Candidatus Thermoplasmatota archaeon]|nr:AAA-associated domain-containing protein [Candidatus Thermoplasmatota archaeon]MCL5963202.1 AAA-associated domain-containing protein [Candidatus Thermoplasmatota archaeon]
MSTTIPKCSVSEMIGFLEILNDYSGTEDLARLARDYGMEIDEILPSVEIAEAMGFVIVENGNTSLTEIGIKFIKSDIDDRKKILKNSMIKLQLFKLVMQALESSPEGRIASSELSNILQVITRHPEKHLRRIINWGRYSQLFNYDSETDEIFIR